jgi:glutamate--cysteine ligase
LGIEFGFDEWLINTYTSNCVNIDFRERKNLECLSVAIDKTMHRIKQKYAQYNIDSPPFVFIKADQGTFGLGMMSLTSGSQIFEINKKQRHSMQKIKLGLENSRILIQEGVPTIEKVGLAVAESMVYSVYGNAVGVFNRFNSHKDNVSNLNSQGMDFTASTILEKSDTRYLINKISCIANILEDVE